MCIRDRLVRLRVVQAQAQTLEVARRTVRRQLDQIRPAVPDSSDDAGAIVFDPRSRPGKRMQQPPQVRPPRTNLEVEIVLSVPPRRTCVGTCAGRDRIRLPAGKMRLQGGKRERQQTDARANRLAVHGLSAFKRRTNCQSNGHSFDTEYSRSPFLVKGPLCSW